MNIKETTIKGEKLYKEYAPVPPSGRGDKEEKFYLDDILEEVEPIGIKKPAVSIVGSLAEHGTSDNDIDLLITGEYSDRDKEAVIFRLQRMFSAILDVPFDEVMNYIQLHFQRQDLPYTSYVPLYSMELQPIQNPNRVEMNLNMELDGNFKVLEKSEDRIIGGYASFAIVDSDSQYIPPEVLEEGLETLLEDDGFYANIMVTHNNIQVGRIVKSYGNYETHVDDKGLFIVAKIREGGNLEIADEVWDKIREGELNSFSIAGEVTNKHESCDNESCWEVIDEINIFEVSLTSRPTNKASTFEVISKSLNENCDVCEEKSKNNKQVNMTEEEKDEELTDTQKAIGTLSEAYDMSAEDLEEAISTYQEEPEEEEDEEDAEEMSYGIVSLSEYTEFLDEYIENNEGADIEDAIEAWQDKYPTQYPYPDEEKGLVGAIKEKIGKLLDSDEISKSDIQELKSLIDKLQQGGGYPTKYPYPDDDDYPTKYPYADLEETVESVQEEIEALESKIKENNEEDTEEKSEVEELQKSLEERDDLIAEYEKRIEKLEKAEEESATKTETDEEIKFKEDWMEKDSRRSTLSQKRY